MIVTPVSGSPAMTARCMGAAPRYLGSSDACTLTKPRRGAISTRRAGSCRRRRRRRGRAQRGKCREKRGVLQPFGLKRQAGLERGAPSRRRRSSCGRGRAADPAASRRRRPCVATRAARRASAPRMPACRRRRCARPRYHFPARVSFRIFRTIRSRLMPRSRSTNSVPSR